MEQKRKVNDNVAETPRKQLRSNQPVFPLFRNDIDEQSLRPLIDTEPNTPSPYRREEPTSSAHQVTFASLGFAPTACETLMRHTSCNSEEYVTQAIRDEINRNVSLHTRPHYIYLNRRVRKRKAREREK